MTVRLFVSGWVAARTTDSADRVLICFKMIEPNKCKLLFLVFTLFLELFFALISLHTVTG